MKRLFFIVVLLAYLPLGAQNLKGFYVQTMHPEGLLYFVLPQKMAEVKGAVKLCRGPLSYDYTYLNSRDSVTLLFSVETNTTFRTDSLIVEFPDGSRQAYATEMIYCEPRKNAWESRFRCVLRYDEWEQMYRAEPFTLKLLSLKNDTCLFFKDKASAWSKIRSRFARLHEMIRLNREK